MNLIFELSKEHINLPKNEILSCFKSEKTTYNILESNENLILIKVDSNYTTIKNIANRLAYTFIISELLFVSSNSLDEITKNAVENQLDIKGTIAVRCKNKSKSIDSQKIIKTLATIYTKNRSVNLTNPNIEIRALITEAKVYVGLKIAEVDRSQFEKRRVQFRPFFSPISLHPKLARGLVNLSCIKKGEILLDPFCGTGGFLIEAGLIGAKVVGGDIEEKMIEGCKKTLDFYKIPDYKLYCSDVGDLIKYIKNVDAVVTDLPYGKSTTTKGEKIINLYARAFESISKIIKKDRIAVIGLSNKDIISLGASYFSLIDRYDFRVHRSLTRYFCVYKN